jgi:hypothetical protein
MFTFRTRGIIQLDWVSPLHGVWEELDRFIPTPLVTRFLSVMVVFGLLPWDSR